MTYSVDKIIQVTTKFVPSGLSNANFGFAVLFISETEAAGSTMLPNEWRDYENLSDFASDGFSALGEAYAATAKWFGSSPQPRQLRVFVKDDLDLTIVDSYTTARNNFWWYITLNTSALFFDKPSFLLAAEWCNANNAILPYTAFGPDPIGAIGGVPGELTALGYRYVFSTYTTDAVSDMYSSFPILAWFANVNYNVPNSTITGEYKTITNTAPSELTSTEQNFLLSDTTKCGFISNIDLQGQLVNNRYINSVTHSANGEYIDDVFNLDAFINAVKVELFNIVANQPTKLQQTPKGQQALLTGASSICEQYIQNGYLGARNYLNPDNGLTEFTEGYEMMSKAEDILDLNDGDRGDRLSAPIVIRIFRAGAIHKVPVDITIY